VTKTFLGRALPADCAAAAASFVREHAILVHSGAAQIGWRVAVERRRRGLGKADEVKQTLLPQRNGVSVGKARSRCPIKERARIRSGHICLEPNLSLQSRSAIISRSPP
jgi:hypothetical protein